MTEHDGSPEGYRKGRTLTILLDLLLTRINKHTRFVDVPDILDVITGELDDTYAEFYEGQVIRWQSKGYDTAVELADARQQIEQLTQDNDSLRKLHEGKVKTLDSIKFDHNTLLVDHEALAKANRRLLNGMSRILARMGTGGVIPRDDLIQIIKQARGEVREESNE